MSAPGGGVGVRYVYLSDKKIETPAAQDVMNGFPCMFPIDMGEPYATAPTPVSWSRVTNVGES